MPRALSIPFARISILMLALLVAWCARAQVLVDDFDRPNADVVGPPWSEAETAPGLISVKGNTLRMASSTAAGMERAWTSLTGHAAMPLNSNTCEVTWMFNMRQSRNDPGGLIGAAYGMGVVLAASTNDPGSGGQGYAVVLGQSGSADHLRLVSYSSGLSSFTPILTSTQDLGNEYISVRVSYLPGSNTWTMYFDTSLVAFEHPALAANLVGTAVNSTYTGSNLPNTVCFWNHSTTPPESAQFDNVYLPSPCGTAPQVRALHGTMPLPEAVGTTQVRFMVLPPPPTPRTLNITLSPTNATYGADHTTIPDGSGGSIAVNVPAWAMVVSVPFTVIDDALPEIPPETVLLTATSLTGGTVGTPPSTLVTIGDDDQGGTVLAPGDIAVVGVNSDNSAFCSPITDDRISFVCFQDIVAGTTIDLTDNGYMNTCGPGPWSDNEGVARMTRTGPTIPAGTVVTWRVMGTAGAGNVRGVGPDDLWTCASLSGGIQSVSLPTLGAGDQLFFLQQGNWVDPDPATSAHNADYSGLVITSFSTNGQWNGTTCLTSSSSSHPDLACVPLLMNRSGNFLKYAGDILTPRTKGEWLALFVDPANWPTTYAHCSDYDGVDHRWQDAPQLPILPGEGTPGIWTGVMSTDWFDCRNWEDRQVPTASVPVVIDQRSLRDCLIAFPNATGTTFAYAASLVVRSFDPAIARILTVSTARRLEVTGQTVVERGTTGSACGLTILGNSWFTTGGLRLTGVTIGANQASFSNTSSGNVVTINGDLRIEPGGRVAMTNGWTNLLGDYTNLNGEALFEENGSTLSFNGSTDQHISTSGFEERFHRIRMTKASGDLYMDNGVRVENLLELNTGRIFENSSLLTLGPSATTIGASDNSFVHGPLLKLGPTDFTFPIGKGNAYRPARLNDNTATNAQGFMAEYFDTSPSAAYPPSTPGPGLHHVSDCEYWTITPSGGTPSARVWLSWQDPYSCGVLAPTDLRVVRWTGSVWEDRGNGGLNGNTVSTALVESAFGPWTLGSSTENNPLPIELLLFEAHARTDDVALTWSTASETDNAFFTVERSADGTTFHPLLVRAGAGNSQTLLHYDAVDPSPIRGLGYYRLRQTDHDGVSSLSAVVPVRFLDGGRHVAAHAADGSLTLFHDHPAGTAYQLLDAGGRCIIQGRLLGPGPSVIPLHGVAHGIYTLRVEGSVLRFAY